VLRLSVSLAALSCALLAGCSKQLPEPPHLDMGCATLGSTDLRSATASYPAQFATSGGPVRLGISYTTSTLFDSDVTETTLYVGRLEPVPSPPDPGHPDLPGPVSYEVTSGVSDPAELDLGAGSWWVVSEPGALLRAESCSGVTITPLGTSRPPPTPSTSTTSPSPGPPTTEPDIPGTSPSAG
jgi:hypothetical protein